MQAHDLRHLRATSQALSPIPALVCVSAVALIVAAVRPRLRSFYLGFTAGALAMLPVALLALGLLFAALDME